MVYTLDNSDLRVDSWKALNKRDLKRIRIIRIWGWNIKGFEVLRTWK